jgi:hypothetical protein
VAIWNQTPEGVAAGQAWDNLLAAYKTQIPITIGAIQLLAQRPIQG